MRRQPIPIERQAGAPRPPAAGGYSFPSGHCSGSIVFLGALAYLGGRMTRHRILTPGALFMAGLLAGAIDRSRVGLKAHHRSEVLGGFATGTVWLALVLRLFARPLGREYHQGMVE